VAHPSLTTATACFCYCFRNFYVNSKNINTIITPWKCLWCCHHGQSHKDSSPGSCDECRWPVFSRAHTSSPTLTLQNLNLPKFNHLIPCGRHDWQSLVTNWKSYLKWCQEVVNYFTRWLNFGRFIFWKVKVGEGGMCSTKRPSSSLCLRPLTNLDKSSQWSQIDWLCVIGIYL